MNMKTILPILLLCSCSAPGTALPAGTGCGLHTDYPGDDACVAPPADGDLLLHYGPDDYSDPAQVAPFVLAPGNESVRLVSVPSPTTEAVYITGWSASERLGMHHLSVLSAEYSIAIVQRERESVRFETPEYPDLALLIPAGNRTYRFQAHAINTTDAPALVEAWVTLHTSASPGTVMSAMVFNGGMKMDVPPHTRQTISESVAAPKPMTVLAYVGHVHSHTTEQRIYVAGQLAYTNRVWGEPPWRWAPQTLAAGQTVAWQCDIDNTLSTPLFYNDHVFTAEMCNVYGYVLGAQTWGVNLP